MRTIDPVKIGSVVEFIVTGNAVEDVKFCDVEDVDEHTITMPRGTTGTVLRRKGQFYVLMIDTCKYLVHQSLCKEVKSYETSIQRELDQFKAAFEELEDNDNKST